MHVRAVVPGVFTRFAATPRTEVCCICQGRCSERGARQYTAISCNNLLHAKLQAFAQNSGARLLFLTAGMLAVQRIVMIYCTRAGLVPPDHLSEGARDYMSAVDFLTALAVCTYFTYW